MPRNRFSSLSFLLLTMTVMLLLASGTPALGQLREPAGPAPQGADGYIVEFQAGTPAAARGAIVRGAGAALQFSYSSVAAVAVTVPSQAALAAIQSNPSVIRVIPNRAVRAFQSAAGNGKGKPGGGGGGPAPQVISEGVKRVGLPTSASDGTGIHVAVVDTGIDRTHSDLNVAPDSYSAFGGSCQDDQGHGTHVSGIVAALDNTIDTLGVAPGATLHCVKVLDAGGSGSDATVMAGLDWVASRPEIRVVNMSLGREGSVGDNPVLHLLVQTLHANGVSIVVAAGNDAALEVQNMVPATYPEVIAVASTTARDGANAGCRSFSGTIPADTASYFTTDGKFEPTTGIGVTISAPGEDQEDIKKNCFISSVGILSSKLGGGTTRLSGTSMASPHVAGIVARILQADGTLAPEGVRSQIWSLAQFIGTTPKDSPTSSYSFDTVREGIALAP